MSDVLSISDEDSRFEVVKTQQKENLLLNRKAQSTNRATKQWVKCLNEYLV